MVAVAVDYGPTEAVGSGDDPVPIEEGARALNHLAGLLRHLEVYQPGPADGVGVPLIPGGRRCLNVVATGAVANRGRR